MSEKCSAIIITGYDQCFRGYTGYGKDVSPTFYLSKLSKEAQSIAIIMDDIKHPLLGTYNHWVIWNLPVICEIPENIAHGEMLNDLGDAVQGIGYGRHRC